MERIVVNHQRRRIKKKEQIIKLLAERMGIDKLDLHNYQLDHIVPYSISIDNSIINLQLIKKKDHVKKSKIDRKILKEMIKEGLIERINKYSFELKRDPSELISIFKGKVDSIDGLDTYIRLNPHVRNKNEVLSNPSNQSSNVIK